MVLEYQSPSKHNTMLSSNSKSSKKIPHPVSTGFYDERHTHQSPSKLRVDHGHKMFGTPSPKRRKTEAEDHVGYNTSPASLPSSSKVMSSPSKRASGLLHRKRHSIDELSNSDDEDLKDKTPIKVEEVKKTQLEEALGPVQTDKEAIEAYEALRAAEAAEQFKEESNDDGTIESRMSKRSWVRGRSSIYLDAFNLALFTVLEDEAHLFDDAEKQVFEYFKNLSYEAQYLYVRLFLRKTSTWFRISKLGYHGDIANIAGAVQELQQERALPEGDLAPEKFPGEPILPEEAVPLGKSFTFAECSDEQITTLDEASSLLLLDELKVLAKDAKVTGKTKGELLHNLRRTSGKQRGLGFLKRSETEGSATSGRSTPAPNDEDEKEEEEDGMDSEAEHTPSRSGTPVNDHNRDAHFTKKILDQTGKCVRLSLIPLKLFERLHLVFYRSIEWTDKSLTTIILAKIAQRNFPEYIVSRSANIFETRAILLEFESCLRIQFRVENILEFSGYATRHDLEEVRALFEAVYPRSNVLLKTEQGKEDRVYESGEGPYLRRFSPAWVYTRVQHKVLAILAKFKEHLREHEMICELLNQQLFHPSKRGVWYQRKALLEEHYMYDLTDPQGRSEEANKKYWKRVALQTCETGLQDRECHIRYHYDLQKRIKKLEKQLKIPKREQHDFGHVGLLKPFEREVSGIQILREDRPFLVRRKSSNSELRSTLSRDRTQHTPTPEPPRRGGGKTIWLDSLDTDLPVSVESLTLSHYRKVLGYKGYHVEGGIIRTLFGLLFYDVLFVYVPNVFQTAYQTCPLDLHTDAFYSTRISEINGRINELSNGDAERILRQVWNDHAHRKTCIIGVRWDFEFEDLLEIVQCWDGAALGTVMRVLAQEYAERGGGVPDLFLWKVFDQDNSTEVNNDGNNDATKTSRSAGTPATTQTQTQSQAPTKKYGTIKFVEVKSENDRLSDSQRLWISVLLNAGVDVELCHVVASEVRREDGTVVDKSV